MLGDVKGDAGVRVRSAFVGAVPTRAGERAMEARSREGVLCWLLVDGGGAVRMKGAGFGCLVEALRDLTASDARLSVDGCFSVRWSRAGLSA